MTYKRETESTESSDEALRLEQEQLEKYRSFYTPQHFSHQRSDPNDYFAKTTNLRLEMVKAAYKGGRVLDLCCGSGDYLLPVAGFAEGIIGLDFSPELIEAAQEKITQSEINNAVCILGNARQLPVESSSISLLFSFSSLYSIPFLEDVLQECHRVLTHDGVAILDFGAASLNTLVCKAHPESAALCAPPLRQILSMLKSTHLEIKNHRSFQILPLWGSRPLWLRPLLHPVWKKIMARELGGRMFDEVISSSPLLRSVAFRHIITCRKKA